MTPLAIDLYTGLHGWSEGLIAEGWRVVGFDIEDMCGQFGIPRPDHVQLVLQDVLTLHGKQFKDAALIVASPPCQEYSYMAMPWSRAKAIAADYRAGVRDVRKLTALFDACFRIQREAIEAAGHFIPMVVENVRGAILWVGRSRWNYGSYHLWGDVPALMPMTKATRKTPVGSWDQTRKNYTPDHSWDTGVKAPGMNWSNRELKGQDFTRIAGKNSKLSIDLPGGKEFAKAARHLTNQSESDHIKQAGISGMRANGKGDRWFQDGAAQSGSKSKARKAASAAIAKIPFALASHIAKHWYPRERN